MVKIKQMMGKESTAGILFVLPFIFGLLVFLVVPMCISLYYSFCDYNILFAPKFVGLKNFVEIFHDKVLWQSMGVTFFYAFVSVPLKLIFALFVAMLLLKNSKVSGIYRAVYYLPSIIGGSVAVSILWKRLFASDGTFNTVLGIIGIHTDKSWLGDPNSAIWILILLTVWQFGSSMLIFLSSLKQIPAELYEASMVDGANAFTRFFKVTLPLLSSTIFFNLVMQTINGFLAFTQCYIITQGKPMNSTLLYTVYMYQQSFAFSHTGYGAAMAWVMLFVIGVITLLLFKTKKFWVYEGGL